MNAFCTLRLHLLASVMPIVLAAPLAQADSLKLTAAEHTPFACGEQLTVAQLSTMKPPRGKKPWHIELSVPSFANPYTQGMAYGAEKAAKAAGVKLTLDAGDGFMDPATQITQLENALSHNPDAVLVNPADPAGLAATIDDTVDNGTPVVDVGTLSTSTKSSKLVQDDYSQGEEAAKAVAKLLPTGGSGIVMGGPANASWARRRVAGFEDALKSYPNLKIAVVTSEDMDPAQGLQKFGDAAQAHPGFTWIYATHAFVLAPQSIPQEYRKVVYVAGGLSQETKSALLNGSLAASLPDFPIWVGYAGLSLAVQELNGTKPPAHVCIPTVAVYPAQANDPALGAGSIVPAGWTPGKSN